MSNSNPDQILDLLRQQGPLSSKDISQKLHQNKESVNSILYGPLHTFVVRDKNARGYPVWRIKTQKFEAAKGLEILLYTELLKHKIITEDNSQVDYPVENTRNGKLYHLDIALFLAERKYNIEVDGFEHMRADARYSIQRQIEKGGDNAAITIDWMDHERSYIDFSLIDDAKVFKWCSKHLDWIIRYHEELIWPDDIKRNIWLIEKGWGVIRFWNEEVRRDLDYCVKQIKAWIK